MSNGKSCGPTVYRSGYPTSRKHETGAVSPIASDTSAAADSRSAATASAAGSSPMSRPTVSDVGRRVVVVGGVDREHRDPGIAEAGLPVVAAQEPVQHEVRVEGDDLLDVRLHAVRAPDLRDAGRLGG